MNVMFIKKVMIFIRFKLRTTFWFLSSPTPENPTREDKFTLWFHPCVTPTTRQGTSAYFVESSIHYKINIIDLSVNKCSRLKLIYLGIPCCHIFSVWRYLNKNILQCIESCINSHWDINKVKYIDSYQI